LERGLTKSEKILRKILKYQRVISLRN